MSLVFHIFPQELQEHRLFCSFYLMNQISISQQLGSESKSEIAVEQIWAKQNYCSSISSFISLMIWIFFFNLRSQFFVIIGILIVPICGISNVTCNRLKKYLVSKIVLIFRCSNKLFQFENSRLNVLGELHSIVLG